MAECPPGGSLGCPQITSAATIKHPHSGFLAGDVFVIRLDMRLKLPENESHSFCADDNSGVYVVRPPLCTRALFDLLFLVETERFAWHESMAIGQRRVLHWQTQMVCCPMLITCQNLGL